MSLEAKEIIAGKFWILENNGEKIATLCHTEEKYLLNNKTGTMFLKDEESLQNILQTSIVWKNLEITETQQKEIYNFPTSTTPYNAIYNLQKKLPLFTKSNKSKSYYCAGYYIIQFDKGWVKSFCPKLVTIERYPYEGPFKTKVEMKQAIQNKK